MASGDSLVRARKYVHLLGVQLVETLAIYGWTQTGRDVNEITDLTRAEGGQFDGSLIDEITAFLRARQGQSDGSSS